MMAGFCTGCGTALQDNVAFCGVCGKAAPGAAPTPTQPYVAPQAAPPPPPPAPPPPAPPPQPVAQPHYAPPPPPVPPQPQYQPAYAAPTPPPPPTRSGPNFILIGLIGVAVLLVLAIAYLLLSRNSGGEAEVAASTSQAAVSAAAEGPAQGPEVTKFVTSTTNIRSMATAQDANSRVVGSLQRGTQVRGVMHEGLAGNSSWLKLSDGRGYVTAVNLSDGPPAEQPVARAAIANGRWCNVATYEGNLRIRTAPAGRIIGGLPRGSRFQAFNEQYDRTGVLWLQIQPVETRYPVGWVSADHVSC